MFHLANILTLTRVVAVPLIVGLLYLPGPPVACSWLAALVFVAASLTDVFDGFVARRQGRITTLGKFLDPLADKLLIGSTLIILVKLGWVEAWIVIVIICRELAVTGLRAVAAEKGEVIAADRFGKLKTILQILAVAPLLWHYPVLGFDPVPAGQVILYLALILTIFSGGNYLYNFYKNRLMTG